MTKSLQSQSEIGLKNITYTSLSGAEVKNDQFDWAWIEAGVTTLGSSTGQKIPGRSIRYFTGWASNIAIVKLAKLLQFNTDISLF